MANSFYNHGSVPATLSQSSSALVRAEFDSVALGFDKLPSLAANPNKALVIDAGGTTVTVTTGTFALSGNFALTGSFNTTFAQQGTATHILPAESGQLLTTSVMLQGTIYGLRLSNSGGDPTNDIDVAAGGAMSTDATQFVSLVSTMTKRLDATWAAGTGNGGRSSSQALADGTWHMFIMVVAGATDIGFDTSVTGANLATDHTATKLRRIGSILRESAAIVLFNQVSDFFFRNTPVSSVNTTNPGTAAVTATLQVPLGVVTQAIVVSIVSDTTPTVAKQLWLSSLDQTDQAPSTTICSLAMDTADTVKSAVDHIKTNTSGQIRYRISTSDADINVRLNTHGWIDTRGQYE